MASACGLEDRVMFLGARQQKSGHGRSSFVWIVLTKCSLGLTKGFRCFWRPRLIIGPVCNRWSLINIWIAPRVLALFSFFEKMNFLFENLAPLFRVFSLGAWSHFWSLGPCNYLSFCQPLLFCSSSSFAQTLAEQGVALSASRSSRRGEYDPVIIANILLSFKRNGENTITNCPSSVSFA